VGLENINRREIVDARGLDSGERELAKLTLPGYTRRVALPENQTLRANKERVFCDVVKLHLTPSI
jgi:hypothetical protein